MRLAGAYSEPERRRIIRHPPPPRRVGSSPPRQIAVRAYEKWEARGKPAETDREDWFEADRQLQEENFATATDLVDQASQESFPASDSPAWTLRTSPKRTSKGVGHEQEEYC